MRKLLLLIIFLTIPVIGYILYQQPFELAWGNALVIISALILAVIAQLWRIRIFKKREWEDDLPFVKQMFFLDDVVVDGIYYAWIISEFLLVFSFIAAVISLLINFTSLLTIDLLPIFEFVQMVIFSFICIGLTCTIISSIVVYVCLTYIKKLARKYKSTRRFINERIANSLEGFWDNSPIRTLHQKN